ncbi:LysM peptidoglycan-binding domain-containing protein [Ciceribacter sp. L1K23]|uniref:LysM peptidoglycan-binding domain-containing protein n=1 Tax=Ciceribacter sp. L1K23 TaxID=2820276 RepID=UPI002011E1DE|nr:LysM peptidoglycan-binding domain-containing protein [Ciceribacter sp. L1K23]
MKNRAGWLALLVLVIATLLMVFFVIPRISEPEQEATAPIAPPIETTISDGSAALEKMGRLVTTATSSVEGLSGLFADGKTPTTEAFAAARATAESAVSALAALEIPEALDSAIKEQMTTVRGYAEETLSLLRNLPTDPQQAASAIAGIVSALKGEEAPSPTPDAPAPAEATPAAEQPAADANSASIMPKFDVLRVEPDGSTVIAGNAAPGAKIEVLNGETVIASVEAGPSGDFAAVLDTPLPPGDHALALRSTGADGTPVVSEEVASVSVPASPDGKLLAMVSKPGEPSRIVTMPETVNEADKQPRIAAEDPSSALPDLPAASTALTAAPPIGADAAAGTESAVSTDIATAETVTEKIQVTAVEIENDRIFIAGTASTKGTVRALVNEQAVGEAAIDGAGNFVVEGQMALAVGAHTIRVELVGADGNIIVAASVPFNRPEGSQVAVVAPPADAANGTMVPLERGAFDKQRDTLAKAFGILQSLFADNGKPSMDDVAAARSSTEIALGALADFRLSDGASAPLTDAVGKTAAAAKTALATIQALPRDVEAVREAMPRLASLIDAVLKAAPALPTEAAPIAQQATETPAASEPAIAESSSPTIKQAPLEASDNSVIIRRGDTLWQISRRVYGQGVRYTTIYLANEDQIINPDLIEPGQIFKVPTDALPNAEEIHRKRLRGQPLN